MPVTFFCLIIGPRGSGKSFFAIHELRKSGNFGYVNFDDEQLAEIEDYNEIIETINTLYENPRFLFLDEIQNLKKWEIFVNRLQRQGYNVILTGSNSNLLSSELATHLTGRYSSTVVLPFSFKEYLNYYGDESELTTGEIKAKLWDYIHHGGYPEPLVKGIERNDYLKTLHDSIIFKDIVKRHNIRSIKPMGELSTYLVSNSTHFISNRTLTQIVGLKSPSSITKYLSHLEEAFLFFELSGFSYKYKDQVTSVKKIFTIDNGFIFARAFSFSGNTGMLYENVVAIELKKRELNKEVDFYYYKNAQGYEVDFVVKKGLEIVELIQVCYNVDNEKTKDREVRALLHGFKDLKCENLVVITEDYEDVETVEWYGIKAAVKFIPLWKWLLTSN